MKTSLSQMEKYYLKQTWISDLEIGNFAMTSFLWIGERLLFYACSDYASVKQRQHIVPFRNIFITVKFCLKLNTLELQQNANLFYNYDLKRSICYWDFISSRHILREKSWISWHFSTASFFLQNGNMPCKYHSESCREICGFGLDASLKPLMAWSKFLCTQELIWIIILFNFSCYIDVLKKGQI